MTNIESLNPATGQVLKVVTSATPQDVEQAVEKAKSAFKSWSQTSLNARLKHLEKGQLWLIQNMDAVSEVISLNNGKPRVESLMSDIAPVIQSVTHYQKYAKKHLANEPIPIADVLPTKKAYMTFSPLGVVGIISPWNYPFSIPMGEVLSALVAGNCVILKPSEVTSLVNEKILQMMTACQLPAGVFQMIEGDGAVGAALTSSSIDKICFTGSVPTGKKVMRSASENLIPVTLELGGKDPCIVLESADLDVASSGVVVGGFYNNGQTCASVERLLVHKNIEEIFIACVREKLARLRVGPTQGFDNDIGPITYQNQKKVIKEQLQNLSGTEATYNGVDNFLKPQIIKTRPTDKVWIEETFGPVIAYDTFTTDEEAVEKANTTNFGLGAVIWGNTKHAQKLAKQLYAGTVVINDAPFTGVVAGIPWGGVKQSGFGKVHGKEGLRDMCLNRVVTYDIQGQARQLWWYPYSKNHYDFLKLFIFMMSSKGLFTKITWLMRMLLGLLKIEKRL